MNKDESFKKLCEEFPFTPEEEISNFLTWCTYGEAYEMILVCQPSNIGEMQEEDEENLLEYFSEHLDPDKIVSENSRMDSFNFKQLEQKYPDFDKDILLAMLDEANNDVDLVSKQIETALKLTNRYDQVAKMVAQLKELYPKRTDEFLRSCLEKADYDINRACEYASQNQNPPKKRKPKKKVIMETGIVIAQTGIVSPKHKKKPKKSKRKTIPSNKQCPTIPKEYQINMNNKRKDNLEKLKNIFQERFSEDEINEVLDNTKDDCSRAANILSQRTSTKDSPSKLDELQRILPNHSITEIEDALAKNNNDENSAICYLLGDSPLNIVQRDDFEEPFKNKNKHAQQESDSDSEFYENVTSNTIQPKKSKPNWVVKKETKYIDLHNYRAMEAQDLVCRELDDPLNKKYRLICFITGSGKHSINHIPILRPLVSSICERRGYKTKLSHDRGVVICFMN